MSMRKENPFVGHRRIEMQKIKEEIRETGKEGIEHKKILGSIQIDGFTEKTALGYLNALHDAELIIFVKGDSLKETSDKWFTPENAPPVKE